MQAVAALGLRLTGFALRRGIHALGVALTLFLALWLGAVIGNFLAGRPDVGMVYGVGCIFVGMIYRVRDVPSAARRHLAIIEHTDPRICLLLATFVAFVVSALGGLLVV